MYTKQVLPIVFGILLLYCSSAIEWSFNFPYYLLLGGITESVDQPFVSTMLETEVIAH